MNGWSAGGIVLALVALEVLVTASGNSASGASQLPGLLAVPGRLAAAWMDPSKPLIPDRSAASSSASSSSASSSPPATSWSLQTLQKVAR